MVEKPNCGLLLFILVKHCFCNHNGSSLETSDMGFSSFHWNVALKCGLLIDLHECTLVLGLWVVNDFGIDYQNCDFQLSLVWFFFWCFEALIFWNRTLKFSFLCWFEVVCLLSWNWTCKMPILEDPVLILAFRILWLYLFMYIVYASFNSSSLKPRSRWKTRINTNNRNQNMSAFYLVSPWVFLGSKLSYLKAELTASCFDIQI